MKPDSFHTHRFDQLSHMQFEAGELAAAIETVRHWLVLAPLHEEAYQRLMRLHFAAGDRAAALRAYDTCRARLATDMQTEPTSETVALASRMRAVLASRRLCPQQRFPWQCFSALPARNRGVAPAHRAGECPGRPAFGPVASRTRAPAARTVRSLSRPACPDCGQVGGTHPLVRGGGAPLASSAARTPLVVFIGDLQWADAASLDVLHYLARRFAESQIPALLLLALRIGEREIPPGLVEWRTGMERAVSLTHVPLGPPLSAEDILRLLQAFRGKGTGTEF